jgi:hypothetical protein
VVEEGSFSYSLRLRYGGKERKNEQKGNGTRGVVCRCSGLNWTCGKVIGEWAQCDQSAKVPRKSATQKCPPPQTPRYHSGAPVPHCSVFFCTIFAISTLYYTPSSHFLWQLTIPSTNYARNYRKLVKKIRRPKLKIVFLNLGLCVSSHPLPTCVVLLHGWGRYHSGAPGAPLFKPNNLAASCHTTDYKGLMV